MDYVEWGIIVIKLAAMEEDVATMEVEVELIRHEFLFQKLFESCHIPNLLQSGINQWIVKGQSAHFYINFIFVIDLTYFSWCRVYQRSREPSIDEFWEVWIHSRVIIEHKLIVFWVKNGPNSNNKISFSIQAIVLKIITILLLLLKFSFDKREKGWSIITVLLKLNMLNVDLLSLNISKRRVFINFKMDDWIFNFIKNFFYFVKQRAIFDKIFFVDRNGNSLTLFPFDFI